MKRPAVGVIVAAHRKLVVPLHRGIQYPLSSLLLSDFRRVAHSTHLPVKVGIDESSVWNKVETGARLYRRSFACLFFCLRRKASAHR
jgi:hypothetical protein